MIVRYGSIRDIADLIAAELSAGELFAGTHMAWAVGQTTTHEEFEAGIANGNLWVVEDGGQAVGYLLAETLDGDFYIDEVAVAGSHQRRGLGRQLIAAAITEAAGRGYTAATLTTDLTLQWNAPYYARLGFVTLDTRGTPPGLAARLASQPYPERRCAMRLDIATSG